MLIHHLFYLDEMRPYYDDIIIHGHGLVNQIGIFSKLCVAVFVFVSGYGLAISTPKGIKLKDFYWHRFKKLYLNYWFIWLLFVPIGIFVFGRTFTDAYGEHVALRGVLDFFGLLKFFGVDSYNPSWWFYSCIILLYLVFPLLNRFIFKIPYFVICVVVVLGGPLGVVPGVKVISPYLLVFLSGILLSKTPVGWMKDIQWWHVLVALLLLCGWRMMKTCPRQFVESLICVGLAILVYKKPLHNWVGNILVKLGKHSMNMFLIHSFIFYYWFKSYIYYTHNPILIFLSLVVTSYALSVTIEWIKSKMGFYKLLK